MTKRLFFLISYSLKELRNNRFFAILFTLNLSLGLVGFILIGNMHLGVNQYFDANLQKILNGDIQISSRQALPKNISNEINDLLTSQSIEFEMTKSSAIFSMIRAGERNALFNITGIQKSFNLYSDFAVEKSTVNSNLINSELIEKQGIWLDESGMDLLQIKKGDEIQIGKSKFIVKQKITKLPQTDGAFSSFVPTAYIYNGYLKDTGLIALGTRSLARVNLKLTDKSTKIETIKQQIVDYVYSKYPDANHIRIRDLNDVNARLKVLFDYIFGYLNLISLVALFLSAIGTTFLFRHYALKRLKSATIAVCLGMLAKDSQLIMLIQLLILSLISCFLAILFGGVISNFLSAYLANLASDFPISFINYSTAFEAILIGVFSAILFSLPIWVSVRKIKPIVLLKNDDISSSLTEKKMWLYYLPGLSFFWLLATYLTSFTQSSLFIAILALILGILAAFMALFCRVSIKLSERYRGVTKMALRNIGRHKNSTISAALALTLGVFLITLVAQISFGIRDEIKQPEGGLLPSYFLIDIQPEQLPPLQKLIQSNNLELEYLSPLIQARLTHINDELTAKRYEKNQQGNKGRFRSFNLSYRDDLNPSEKIVAGDYLSKQFNAAQPAEISVEQKFAERNNLKINDNLTFDIQGVEVKAIIKNFRSVRWNTFQPNFFVLFQPKALELAPKTYIANIPKITTEQKSQFHKELANQFPNISAVDIQKLIDSTLEIGAKALSLIFLLAFIVALSGLMVLLSISIMRAYDKKSELALLKTIGLSKKLLRRFMLIEFSLPALMSLILGIVLSLVFSSVFSYVIFGTIFAIYPEVVLVISIFALLLIMLLAFFAGEYVSKVKVIFNLETND